MTCDFVFALLWLSCDLLRFDHFYGAPFSNAEKCADEDNPLRCFLYRDDKIVQQVSMSKPGLKKEKTSAETQPEIDGRHVTFWGVCFKCLV